MFERGKKDRSDKGTMDTSHKDYEHTPAISSPPPTPLSSAAGRTETAVIGRSIRIDGDLRGEEDLRIEGDVNGTVQLRNNTLTIGSEGKISANVYAKSVTVDGLMEGDVFGSERVSIRKNARVKGNITAPRVSLEDGAKFKGSIEMDPAEVDKALGKQSGATRGAVAMDAPAIASRSNGETRIGKPGKAAVNKGTAKNDSLG